jgi:type VI secretion system VgrG family protein
MAVAVSSHDLVQVRIELDGLPEDAFAVVSLEGREAISRLFEVDVAVVSTQPADIEALLGLSATLVFERGETEVRRMFGMIAAVHDSLETEAESFGARFTFVPRAHRMTLRETLDIFMDLTVPEIVEKKLQLAGLARDVDYDLRLIETYAKREFVVQYRETDLAFVSRLCEHIGLSFFFDHRDGRDIFVLTDHNGGFRRVSDVPQHFRPRGDRRDVYRLESTARMIPSGYIVRDYNYRTPQLELAARADVDGAGGEVIEYGSHFKTNEEAARIAKIRSEEQLAAQRVFEGESDVADLRAGGTFALEGHARGDLDLLVTEITHRVTQAALGGGADVRRYTNRFRAIRAATSYRPPRVTPKPKVHGVLTGVVDVSKVSQYAELDNEGRYRVKFLFDTSETPGGQASRPVRMMQPHSGAGYGMHFPLRSGIEVLIVCIDGDPDRPIIAGTVPNPQTGSPVVAGNAPRNIIRTGGNNEINIDDTEDAQRIKITTPRRNTVLQLGAQNDPVDGISLKTEGHASTMATEGASQWNSFGTQMSAMVNLLRSGNILNVASQPSLLTVAAAGVSMAQAVVVSGMPGVQDLYGRNKSWIVQEQQKLAKEEAEVNTLAVQAKQSAEAKMEECNACKLAAKKVFPARPTPQNPSAPTDAELAAMAKYDEISAAIDAYDAAVNAADAGYLATAATQDDRNGIVDVNRANFFNADFEQQMNTDTYAALAAYDYAKFAALKAGDDEARWDNFNAEQKSAIEDQGITREEWLAGERAKWDTPAATDAEVAAAEAEFNGMSAAEKNQIPISIWAAAGIPADKMGHFADLTDEQKAALQAAWVADKHSAKRAPDLKAEREQAKAALLAALGDDPYYTAYKNALADCAATCSTELDAARETALQANENFFRKMKDTTQRLHQLQDLSNKNDQALVTHMGTAINGLIAVMAALELLFARTSLIERWGAATLTATASTTVAKLPQSDLVKSLGGVSAEVAKLAIPFWNPQHTNVVGSDASTEVFGQRDLVMWSETAMLLGMGSKDRFASKAAKAAAKAAGFIGIPLPGDKPDPTKGKVIIMGMETVEMLSKGTMRVQADKLLSVVSRDGAAIIARDKDSLAKSSRLTLHKGKVELSLQNNAPVEKASLKMSLANNKGKVELRATAAHALKLDENTKKTTLNAGQTNKLELNAQANTAELLAATWKLKLTQGDSKGVHLGSDAWHLKIKNQDVKLGGPGPHLKITDQAVTLRSAQNLTLAAPQKIYLNTGKVMFGAAVIDSTNLMVKGDYDPAIAQMNIAIQTAQQTANQANVAAGQAQQTAATAQDTADEADLKGRVALLLLEQD